MAFCNAEFFLGATGENGFVNRFADVYNNSADWRVYIIKGGAGCGKSTFMKRLADSCDCAILCRCSSDPQSLDAVILPDKKVMIADGTAPHILEPKYAGMCERIVNFFDILDSEMLYKNRNQIREIYKENAQFHKQAKTYISCAGAFLRSRFETATSEIDNAKCRKFASSIAKKYIKKKGESEKIYNIYLEAVTPDGWVCFNKTPNAFCENVITIADDFGAVADAIIRQLLSIAKANNHTVFACYNPILPDVLRGIILPECNFAVVCTDFLSNSFLATKKVHFKRFYKDTKVLTNEQMKFCKKSAKFMISNAEKELRSAKLSHDRLEKYYISVADFPKTDDIFKKVLTEIENIE